MHGQKKPRQPRPLKNPIISVALYATLLTEAEVQHHMAPIRRCEAQLAQGAASSTQLSVLETSIKISQQVEKSRIVTGLADIIEAGRAALYAIRQRSCSDDNTWQPATPTADELDAVTTAMTMHQFQLRKVTAGEICKITDRIIAQAKSSGDGFTRIATDQWSAEQLHAACAT